MDLTHLSIPKKVPRTDPLVQVDYVRVVDLDIGAGKSDICAVGKITTSERAGGIRRRKSQAGVETLMESVEILPTVLDHAAERSSVA